MNTEKSEKASFCHANALLPYPLGLVGTRRHPRWPVFRKFLVHAGIAVTFFLIYRVHSTSCFVGLKKGWQEYHDKKDSYDSYIKRIEEGYL